jgi:VanZ family protein
MLRLTSMPLFVRIAIVVAVVTVLAFASLEPDMAPFSANNADLWLHGAAYGGLTVILVALFARPVVCALTALAISGALEGLQDRIPSRSANWEDAMANAAGVALAFIALLCLRRYLAARAPARHPS